MYTRACRVQGVRSGLEVWESNGLCSVKLNCEFSGVLNQEQRERSQSHKSPSTHGANAQGLEWTRPGLLQAQDTCPSSFFHVDVFYFFNPWSMIQIKGGSIVRCAGSAKGNQNRRALVTTIVFVAVSVLPNPHIHHPLMVY